MPPDLSWKLDVELGRHSLWWVQLHKSK